MKILLAIILALILTTVIAEPVMAYDVPYHPGNDSCWEIDPDTGIATPIDFDTISVIVGIEVTIPNGSPNYDYLTGKILVHGIDYGWDTSVAGGKFWVKR